MSEVVKATPATAPLRCAYCKGDFLEDSHAAVCTCGCKAHVACAREHGSCPTCGGELAFPEGPPQGFRVIRCIRCKDSGWILDERERTARECYACEGDRRQRDRAMAREKLHEARRGATLTTGRTLRDLAQALQESCQDVQELQRRLSAQALCLALLACVVVMHFAIALVMSVVR